MYYYAQHTRQVTDFAGIKGPSKIGRRGHLAAARAVNELCDAVARLAPAAASEHNDCLTAAGDLQRINDKSATMDHRDDDKPILQPKSTKLYDNLLKRSIKNYHIVLVQAAEGCAGFDLAASNAPGLRNAREGFCQRGIPFHVYIPL